jgi:hypothetical protein
VKVDKKEVSFKHIKDTLLDRIGIHVEVPRVDYEKLADIDTDNGGVFIDEVVIAYCEQEHIAFTRGRAYPRNDQCTALAEKWCDRAKGWWATIAWWGSTLVANPERSSDDIFRELQRRSPGRYQPLQIRTLQRGMRKIRVHLLQTLEEQWQEEVIRGSFPISVSAEGPPAYPDRSLLTKTPG